MNQRNLPVLAALSIFVLLPGELPAGEDSTWVGTGPPELGLAAAVGRNTIQVRRFGEQFVKSQAESNTPNYVSDLGKSPADDTNPGQDGGAYFSGPIGTVPVGFTSTAVVQVAEARVNANSIVAQRIDGKALSAADLMPALKQARPVILMKQGARIDPLFARIFRPDALVLFGTWQRVTPDPKNVLLIKDQKTEQRLRMFPGPPKLAVITKEESVFTKNEPGWVVNEYVRQGTFARFHLSGDPNAVPFMSGMPIDWNGTAGRTLNGTSVPQKKLAARFQTPTPAINATDHVLPKQGAGIDPRFSVLFKPDTLVLFRSPPPAGALNTPVFVPEYK